MEDGKIARLTPLDIASFVMDVREGDVNRHFDNLELIFEERSILIN